MPRKNRVAGERRPSGIIRRHKIASDPILLLKQKLVAACYAFNRNWGKLFGKMDADHSGSLDSEEFRLALRRIARVPQKQMTDDEILQLFNAIDSDNGGNGTVELSEFAEFMNRHMEAEDIRRRSGRASRANAGGETSDDNVLHEGNEDDDEEGEDSDDSHAGDDSHTNAQTGADINDVSQPGAKAEEDGPSGQSAVSSAHTDVSVEAVKYSRVVFHVTGFGKFNGVEDNPTTHLVEVVKSHPQLFSSSRHEIGEVCTFVVSTTAVDAMLARLREVTLPARRENNGVRHIWIHLGVHGGINKIHLEKRCYNDMSFRVPDEAGFQPEMGSLIQGDSGGAKVEFLDTNIPVDTVCEAPSLKGKVVPSTDPGRFLCNYVYFQTLFNTLSDVESGDVAAGKVDGIFVHVPPFEALQFSDQVRLLSHTLHHIAEAVLQ